MIDDIRQSPATLTLAALWLLIFALMQVRQETFAADLNLFRFGAVSVNVTHQFGDATSAELRGGQLWRAITSTFIHYNTLHLLLNLFGLVQLGLLIEHWYGSAQFLAIYVLIGGLGNLLAGYLRPTFGIPDYVHCGGGSTVVFGLIALCAVVGWRSHSQPGRSLGLWMVVFLVFNIAAGFGLWLSNAMMGLGLPNFDNLAHLAGTLLGAALGLLHQTLKRAAWLPAAQRLGAVSAVILVACMGAQSATNRQEVFAADKRASAQDRWQSAGTAVATLLDLDLLYRMSYQSGASPRSAWLLVRGVRGNVAVPIPARSQLEPRIKHDVEQLETLQQMLGTGQTAADFDRLMQLAEQAAAAPPTRPQVDQFEASLKMVLKRAEQEYRTGFDSVMKLSKPAAPR